jgi:hypothetical protein
MMWWGYIHENGSLHVKIFFGPEDLSEARESPFVRSVHGPWKVNSREEALDRLRKFT